MSDTQRTPDTFREWFEQTVAPRLDGCSAPVMAVGALGTPGDCLRLFDRWGDEIWEIAVQSRKDLVAIGEFAEGADSLRMLSAFKQVVVLEGMQKLVAELVDIEAVNASLDEGVATGATPVWALRAGRLVLSEMVPWSAAGKGRLA